MGADRFVFAFEEGDGKNKMLLGGKGASLAEMTQTGLNVPPGFILSTEACLAYLEHNSFPPGLMDEIRAHMQALEKRTGKGFGSGTNPLLVSVRSGSAMAMPGMMDTILNLGLNAKTLAGLIERTGDPRFAYDAYRRFVLLFGTIALGVPDEKFEAAMDEARKEFGAEDEIDMNADQLKELGESFGDIVKTHTGAAVPEDPYRQLEVAIQAVFRSWMGQRAIDYRKQFKIAKEMVNGTAVSICAMVFGNMGNGSATGVGFTRNPGTGANEPYGEYLVNAQGVDVVAGIRAPKPIVEMQQEMPVLYDQLMELRSRLEKQYKEVQDYEFTIEKGTLYCLQTGNAKMNARATVITSVEMFTEGILTKEQALLRIKPQLLEQLTVPTLSPQFRAEVLATGLPASPGAASGKIVFDADTAERLGKLGERVVLVRQETRPEDIHGFFAAQGILTSRGSKTSHAAVVARGMGKPCVSGCAEIEIDMRERRAKVGSTLLFESDVVTIDGSTGKVYAGQIPTVEAEFFPELREVLKWADEFATLKVYANADTPRDAERARRYGAMGIGLCRTERMFNDADRLPFMHDMILAETVEERNAALDKLLPIQRADFKDMFKAMAGFPVTVRLLDPPIHEFLPSADQLEFEIDHLRNLRRSMRAIDELPETLKLLDDELHRQHIASLDALQTSLKKYRESHHDEEMVARKEAMLRKVYTLTEVNPMLGHRGVRLGITYPEIYAMQIQAILEATAECIREGVDVQPEIIVPQVCTVEELKQVHALMDAARGDVEARFGVTLKFKFGSMIEVVRACMRAAHLAEVAEFFSFGTNDLTQATFSFSREDAENKFLPLYNEAGILKDNPFEVLDVKGVGRLMQMAVQWGRETRPGLKIGICGEQGGQPDSVRFCHHIGLNYVSCSVPRVPIARMAAAQAKLLEQAYGDRIFD